MDYLPWLNDSSDEGLAWIESGRRPELEPNGFRLTVGEVCASWFPKNLAVPLDKRNGKRLGNALPNTKGWLFVDEKIKTIFDFHARPGAIEYLPVKVRDLEKTLVERPYWIANILTLVDAADMARSEFEMDEIIPTEVSWFSRLVLDPTRIPEDAPIFRVANKPELVLLRRDLVKALLDAKCTGMAFVNLNDYGAAFRP